LKHPGIVGDSPAKVLLISVPIAEDFPVISTLAEKRFGVRAGGT
jgi:hypothetical protein